MQMINEWLRIIHKSLYPPNCLVCGHPGEESRDLCAHCAQALPYNHMACKVCGLRLPDRANSDHCGKCSLKMPEYDLTRALFAYQEPVRFLILSLKFHSNFACARLLGNLMSEYLRSFDAPIPELIIPVPLHRDRLKQRGFNQSIEIARPIAKTLAIPMALDLCIRRRPTAPQSGLGSTARRKNLNGAFELTRPLEQKHVAIVDDVVTTGGTVNEIAKVLRKNRAEQIEVWTIARANLDH
ncbi:MAG: double zinc ribbon domain-containing protein [Gammaproteobacteria bacterium]